MTRSIFLLALLGSFYSFAERQPLQPDGNWRGGGQWTGGVQWTQWKGRGITPFGERQPIRDADKVGGREPSNTGRWGDRHWGDDHARAVGEGDLIVTRYGDVATPHGALDYDLNYIDSFGRLGIMFEVKEDSTPDSLSRNWAAKYPLSKPFRTPVISSEKRQETFHQYEEMFQGWVNPPFSIPAPKGCEAYAFKKYKHSNLEVALAQSPDKTLVRLTGVKSYYCLGDSLAALVENHENASGFGLRLVILKQGKHVPNQEVFFSEAKLSIQISPAPRFLITREGELHYSFKDDGTLSPDLTPLQGTCSQFGVRRIENKKLEIVEKNTLKIRAVGEISQMQCIGLSIAFLQKETDGIYFSLDSNRGEKHFSIKKRLASSGEVFLGLGLPSEKQGLFFKLGYQEKGIHSIEEYNSDGTEVVRVGSCVSYTFTQKKPHLVSVVFQGKEAATVGDIAHFTCTEDRLAIIANSQNSSIPDEEKLFLFEKGRLIAAPVSGDLFRVGLGPQGYFRVWYKNKGSDEYIRTKTLLVSYDGKKRLPGMGSPEFPSLEEKWRLLKQERERFPTSSPLVFEIKKGEMQGYSLVTDFKARKSSDLDFESLQNIFDNADKPTLSEVSSLSKDRLGICIEASGERFNSLLFPFKYKNKFGIALGGAEEVSQKAKGGGLYLLPALPAYYSSLSEISPHPEAFKSDSLFFFKVEYEKRHLFEGWPPSWFGYRMRVIRSETHLNHFIVEKYLTERGGQVKGIRDWEKWVEREYKLEYAPLRPILYCLYVREDENEYPASNRNSRR